MDGLIRNEERMEDMAGHCIENLTWLVRRELCGTNFELRKLLQRKMTRELVKGFESTSFFEMESPPYALQYSTGLGDRVMAADEEGIISIFNTPEIKPTYDLSTKFVEAEQEPLLEFASHVNAVFDVKWLQGNDRILTASGDHSIRLWDASRGDFLSTFSGHTSSVKSLALFHMNPNLFVSGSRDGSSIVWDLRVAARHNLSGPDGEPSIPPVVEFRNIHNMSRTPGEKPHRRSVRPLICITNVVVSHDDQLLITGGANDGMVKFWDIRNAPRKKGGAGRARAVNHVPYPDISTTGTPHGVASLGLHPTRDRLVVNYVNSGVYSYDFYNPQRTVMKYSNSGNEEYKCSSFYVRSVFSPDGDYILSGSSTGYAFVWESRGNVEGTKNDPITTLGPFHGEVSYVSWHPQRLDQVGLCDDATLQFCSIDNRRLLQQQRHENKENHTPKGLNLVHQSSNLLLKTTTRLGPTWPSPSIENRLDSTKKRKRHHQQTTLDQWAVFQNTRSSNRNTSALVGQKPTANDVPGSTTMPNQVLKRRRLYGSSNSTA